MNTEEEEDNISNLALLVQHIAPDVLHRFFKTVILKGKDFNKYLEDKIHTIFHLHHTIQCCVNGCKTKHSRQKKVLSAEQFNLLFETSACEVKSHVKKIQGRLVQKCICGIRPVMNVKVEVMDITLICCVIKQCESMQKSEEDRLEIIKNVRNKIAHSSISRLEFNDYWTKLEGALRGLAKLVSDDFEKNTNGRIFFTKKRKLSDSCHNEQMKVIIQRLHDKITEKEGIMHMMSRTQQKCLTTIDYLMTRIGVPTSGIGVQSETIDGWLAGDSGIEPEESLVADQPEGSVGADQPEESVEADQSEESEKCNEGLACSSVIQPNASNGSRILCSGVQPEESDDHQTSRIWIQPKPNGRCQISGNGVERVETKESGLRSNNQLVRMLSMEDDVFLSKEPHKMDYILDEMKRIILQKMTMTPAEVSRFLDILLEIANDKCHLETNDHKHCSDCVNQECNVMSGSHSCEMFLCKCGRRLHVCKLEDHKVICLSEEVECINKSNGCEATLLRSDLVAHLEKCPASVLVCSLHHGIYQEKCRECKEVKIPNANIGSCQHFQKCHEFIRRDEISWHQKNIHVDICEELFGAHALICPYKISGCTYTAVKHLPENMPEFEDIIPKENVEKNRSTDMPQNIFMKNSHIINWYLKALNINHFYSTNSHVKSVCQSVCTLEDVVIPIWEKESSSWSLVRFETISTGSFSPIQKWKHCDTRAYFRHISLCPYKPKVEEEKKETKNPIINSLTLEYVTRGMGNK